MSVLPDPELDGIRTPSPGRWWLVTRGRPSHDALSSDMHSQDPRRRRRTSDLFTQRLAWMKRRTAWKLAQRTWQAGSWRFKIEFHIPGKRPPLPLFPRSAALQLCILGHAAARAAVLGIIIRAMHSHPFPSPSIMQASCRHIWLASWCRACPRQRRAEGSASGMMADELAAARATR